MSIEYKSDGCVVFNSGTDRIIVHCTVEQKILIKAIENDYETRLETAYRKGAIETRDAMRKRLGVLAKSL